MTNEYTTRIAAVEAMADVVCESDGIVGCKGEDVLLLTCSRKLISILGGFWSGSAPQQAEGYSGKRES